MKKSKLEPHAEWLGEQLRAGLPVARIHRELKKTRHCDVALETLRQWITRRRGEGQIKIAALPRGRPPKTPKGGLDFLPDDPTTGLGSVSVPVFFFALLQPEALERISFHALDAIGIEKTDDDGIASWAAKIGRARVARLSDLDFCLIEFLTREDGQMPWGKSPDEIDAWTRGLLIEAAKIRTLVRKSVGLQRG